MMRLRAFLGLAAIAGLASGASAASGQDPDWPCQQRKVPELSVAQVWTGPDVTEALSAWRNDDDVAALVRQIAPRRVDVADANAAIASFVADMDPATKEEKLVKVFAGVFASLDDERSEVMRGIDRYARRQKAFAEQIRADQSKLSALQSSKPDAPETTELTEQIVGEVRVFNDRRTSLTYVCEVPTLIEQRVFQIARGIQSELPQ